MQGIILQVPVKHNTSSTIKDYGMLPSQAVYLKAGPLYLQNSGGSLFPRIAGQAPFRPAGQECKTSL